MGSVESVCSEKASICSNQNLLHEETGQNCTIFPTKEKNASNNKTCVSNRVAVNKKHSLSDYKNSETEGWQI